MRNSNVNSPASLTVSGLVLIAVIDNSEGDEIEYGCDVTKLVSALVLTLKVYEESIEGFFSPEPIEKKASMAPSLSTLTGVVMITVWHCHECYFKLLYTTIMPHYQGVAGQGVAYCSLGIQTTILPHLAQKKNLCAKPV